MDPAPPGSSAQAEARLEELDHRITMLRAAYERYFHGADRTPPDQQRKDVVRLLHQLEHKTTLVSTAQKFRLRTLVQGFQTYRRYWDRTCKEIEEGTYRRDVLKAQRRMEYKKKREDRLEARAFAQGADDRGDFALDLELDAFEDLDAFAQSILAAPAPSVAHVVDVTPVPAAPAPIPASPLSSATGDEERRRLKIMEIQRKLNLQPTAPPSVPTPVSLPTIPLPVAPSLGETPSAVRRAKLQRLRSRVGTNTATGSPRPLTATSGEHRVVQRRVKPVALPEEDPVETVYKNLLEAKRRCNESTQGLSYENVAESIAQQRERYKEKGASDVEFKVVIKQGKAFLKPEPK